MLKKIGMLIACLLILTACNELPDQIVEPEKKTEESSKEKDPWISSYELELEKYLTQYGNAVENISYYITDIDKNGIPELIVKVGNSENSTIADVFTYEEKIKNIGNFSMNQSFIFATSNKYIIRQAILNNHEYIYNISLEDGEIKEELEEDTDYTTQENFAYKTFKNELDFYSISDYTPIEEYKENS